MIPRVNYETVIWEEKKSNPVFSRWTVKIPGNFHPFSRFIQEIRIHRDLYAAFWIYTNIQQLVSI